MKKYEGICGKYEKISRKYEKICEKYVENMKTHEEICRYIGFGTPISIWALGLREMRLGKIPNSPPLYGP